MIFCNMSIVIALELLSFFFIGQDNSYSVLLPDDMTLVQVDSLEEGMVSHMFLGKAKDSSLNFEYTLSFSAIKDAEDDLFSIEKVKEYEENCACLVLEKSKSEFTNFNVVQYIIEKQVNENVLHGVSYFSTIKNNRRINIVSMTLSDNKGKLIQELKPILNTMILNL